MSALNMNQVYFDEDWVVMEYMRRKKKNDWDEGEGDARDDLTIIEIEKAIRIELGLQRQEEAEEDETGDDNI